MEKRLFCFVAAVGLLLTLSACKLKQNGNDSSNASTNSNVSQAGTSYQDGTSEVSGTNTGSKSNATASSKTNSAGASSKKTVSNSPAPVTTNTVTISGDKVIQTIKFYANTQVFTYTFVNNKVSACNFKATCGTAEEAEQLYENFYGSNRFVTMYNNLEVKDKVVTADYAEALLKDYSAYSPSSLKAYLESAAY